MIHIGSDTDIGMDRNSSDWLGMNSYPILLPEMSKKFPKNSKFLVLKYIKMLEFLRNPNTFLHKGTKHKKIVWKV